MAATGITSVTRLVVLAALMRGSRHAYELGQDIARISGGRIAIGDGTLYPLLQTLVKEGSLESWDDRSTSGRSVRMYALRQRGRTELSRLSSDWAREREGVEKLLHAAEDV